MPLRLLRWPYPYKWAFGITDDTDSSTLPAVRAVYDFCLAHDIVPTKSVWMHEPLGPSGDPARRAPIKGVTLEDPSYLEYCKALSRRGVEMCLHDVSAGNNPRSAIVQGLERFHSIFGYHPRLHIFHSYNCDHIYWGTNHYSSPVARFLVRLVMGEQHFHGENPESPYYWSDVCRKIITYVRLYRTRRLNVLRMNPSMPYHLEGKPDVKLWFTASSCEVNPRRVTDRALDRIAAEDGAFILYTYSSALVRKDDKSRLKADTESVLSTIGARTDCWRTQVSRILDRCLAAKNVSVDERRNAYVLSNPSNLALDDFQFVCARERLYSSSGEVLEPDGQGRYHLRTLPSGACLALYFSAEAADAGDTRGISRRESARLMLAEMWHLLAKRPKQLRRRVGRRATNQRGSAPRP